MRFYLSLTIGRWSWSFLLDLSFSRSDPLEDELADLLQFETATESPPYEESGDSDDSHL